MEIEIGGGRSRIAMATSCGSLFSDFFTREFPKSRPRRRYADFSDMLILVPSLASDAGF